MSPQGTTGRSRPSGVFGRSDRLLDSRDFRRVLREGRRRANSELVVFSASVWEKANKNSHLDKRLKVDSPTDSPVSSRIGITASRKVGNAVVRNRFKRRIREWFRMRRHDFPSDIDLVVIARKSGAQLSIAELDQRLSRLLALPASPSPPDDSEIASPLVSEGSNPL